MEICLLTQTIGPNANPKTKSATPRIITSELTPNCIAVTIVALLNTLDANVTCK
jgi:hypothetical protein